MRTVQVLWLLAVSAGLGWLAHRQELEHAHARRAEAAAVTATSAMQTAELAQDAADGAQAEAALWAGRLAEQEQRNIAICIALEVLNRATGRERLPVDARNACIPATSERAALIRGAGLESLVGREAGAVDGGTR